eukprot:TRINITY_DN9740_c0_g1_i2.p1 TRINITY_DN9740_c0_g1~~TRINITY_DN9740_c0_g1_i2.p1  ORF type:complete len:572 (+),score=195.30 TRINITY_DN9740_c0_g1_i2:60-1718(+)
MKGTIEARVEWGYGQLQRLQSDLDKYVLLQRFQQKDVDLFYGLLTRFPVELVPIVYTPVIGQVCTDFSRLLPLWYEERRPNSNALVLSFFDNQRRGVSVLEKIRSRLGHLRRDQIKVIVITDGERILGLGDLGVNGLGIPIGKLNLYCACAGIDPSSTLPVVVDVGTNNKRLLDDPLYLGERSPRIERSVYYQWMNEVVMTLHEYFQGPLIQFEDFANFNAFKLLDIYRSSVCTFNDDIQGTAAAALGGILSAIKLLRSQPESSARTPSMNKKVKELKDVRFLFYGAGSAGLGIADLIAMAIVDQSPSVSLEEAKRSCWFVDSKGLISSRRDVSLLTDEKKPFAHALPAPLDHDPGLLESVELIRPHVLIGVSGQGQSFTQKILETFSSINETPLVFALSNPTSKSECTAEEAYKYSQGRAVFSSGSPFAPLEMFGKRYVPGQGNNSYIFPGLGLGVVLTKAAHVSDRMFLVAAKALADQVTPEEMSQGSIYPFLTRIREVSGAVAEAVAEESFSSGLARVPRPSSSSLSHFVRSSMYDPFQELYPVLSPRL